MGRRGVGEEALGVEDPQLVDAVGQNLVFDVATDGGADDDGMEFDFQLVGQLATLGQQLLGDFAHLRALDFNIYKYVVHIFFVF